MTTRDEVLAALRAAGAAGVSGQALAERFGVSRVSIAKHVAALREAGYLIDATPGSGYRFASAPDLAIPSEVRPLLADPFWERIEGGAETNSTNDDARALARAGAPEGTVVVAARQLAGRGRLGRRWVSPEGGAYVSVVLRPPVAPVEAAALPLVVAVGVARGLRSLGVEPRLKWPNDVWIGDRKVCGILLESAAEGDRVSWVVAGFGLNVLRGEGASDEVAHVSDFVAAVTPSRVAAAVLDGVASAYRQWREEGFSRLSDEFEGASVLTGNDVVVSDAAGDPVVRGRVEGIDAEGRLLVRDEGGVTRVAAGDVTLRHGG